MKQHASSHFLFSKTNLFLLVFFIATVLSRLWIQEPNISLMSSFAMLLPMMISSMAIAIALPIAVLIITDLMAYELYPSWVFVYTSFILISILSRIYFGSLIQTKIGLTKIGAFSIFSSVLFFMISNLGVFLEDNLYPRNWTGFMDTYVMAIPFFKWQPLMDLAFSVSIYKFWEVFIVPNKSIFLAKNNKPI